MPMMNLLNSKFRRDVEAMLLPYGRDEERNPPVNPKPYPPLNFPVLTVACLPYVSGKPSAELWKSEYNHQGNDLRSQER